MLTEFKVVSKVKLSLQLVKLIFERLNADLIKLTVIGEDEFLISLNASVGVDEVIALRPTPPAGFKVGVDYLMVKFSETVVLLPKKTISVDLRIPADLGVYVDEV